MKKTDFNFSCQDGDHHKCIVGKIAFKLTTVYSPDGALKRLKKQGKLNKKIIERIEEQIEKDHFDDVNACSKLFYFNKMMIEKQKLLKAIEKL